MLSQLHPPGRLLEVFGGNGATKEFPDSHIQAFQTTWGMVLHKQQWLAQTTGKPQCPESENY
jgi:hypothetical protein